MKRPFYLSASSTGEFMAKGGCGRKGRLTSLFA